MATQTNNLRFFLDRFAEEENTTALNRVRLLLFCSAAPLVLFMSVVGPKQMKLYVGFVRLAMEDKVLQQEACE